MFSKQSLITRIAIGKTIGLLVGLSGFFLVPHFLPNASPLLPWGILLWYITFGAIVGIYGVLDRLPVVDWRMPCWLRGALTGAWLNFVLVFFAHEPMGDMLTAAFNGAVISPFWFALEGAILGLIIDAIATHFAGEGKSIAGR